MGGCRILDLLHLEESFADRRSALQFHPACLSISAALPRAWSGERTLLSCAWSDDAALIQSYLSLCRQRTQLFSDHPDENFDVRSMFEAKDLCVSVASPGVGGRGERTGKRPVRSVDGQIREGQAERSDTHQRVKRGLTVPGTLWCGVGNSAPSYKDLGVFPGTDRCCREHDHCKHTIQSFHTDFGLFNDNIATMSHCNCDNKFRRCLMKVKDIISDVVGYTFFNVLKMHCFDLSNQLQCKGRNWFGMCEKTEMALRAEIRPSTLYKSSKPTKSSTSCAAYKDLDECGDKILPQEKKYGLLNAEATTLYHCSCTTRLFQTLMKQRHLTVIQALLVGHVSQSCFLPQDCTAGQNCAAVLVKSKLPQLNQRSGTDTEKHLQAVKLKDGGLYNLCLRMVQPKLSKNQDVRQREFIQM